MKKFFGLIELCLAALFLAATISCSNSGGSPIILPQAVETQKTGEQTATQETAPASTQTPAPEPTTIKDNGQSDNPNFLTSWETMEDLCINDSGKLGTKVAAPWNKIVSATLLPDSVRFDVKKEDGWDVAFDFLNQDDLKDMNYFGLYNKYTGVLRIFYYYNREVSQSATDFAFEVVLGSDGSLNKSYYSSLNYGIPLNAEVDMNKNLLGDSGSAKTFRFLVTPYSGIGRNTMTRGWYAFDINLSAYSGKSLSEEGSSIQITCRANNKTNVTLATNISGKLDGRFDTSKLSASSSGIGGILGDIGSAIGGVSKAAAATIKACLSGGILGGVKAAGLWASSIFNIASKAAKGGGSEQNGLDGKMDLKLNATANTTGYLESAVATNVEPFTMTKAAFNKDSNVGKGVWNIDKSPELYFVSNKIIYGEECHKEDERRTIAYITKAYYINVGESGVYVLGGDKCRFPYFYDPSSFEVTINKEIFPDAENIKVLSYCGIYKNDDNSARNSAFRTALGLGDLETNGLALPSSPDETADESYYKCQSWKKSSVGDFFCHFTEDQYKECELKFDGLSYKSFGKETDIHYHGQELSMDGSDSALNFIVEPQIYYACATLKEGFSYYYSDGLVIRPTRLPELYVVVIVQFESGGKIFNYSRVYLPKVSEVKFDEAKTIVNGIKTRLAAQTDKIYKDEYIASLDKKIQFWGTN